MFKILTFLFISVCTSPCAFAMENVLYMLRSQTPDALPAALTHPAHNSLIQVLAPQAYQVNEKGAVLNNVNPALVEYAQKNHVKLMPLVTNASFNRELTHNFLVNVSAQDAALQFLLTECKKNKFYGLQFDFENIVVADKKNFSQFYLKASKLLHDNHFAISLAVVPTLSDNPPATLFLQKRYEHWTGVYDYKLLGDASDFVSLMAYDQHINDTTPGPIASLPWVETAVKYALKYIPSNKISLGIPLYSARWIGSPSLQEHTHLFTQMGYKKMQEMAFQHKSKLQWDSHAKVPFTFYENNWQYEYIFGEDARSFKAKLSLVKKYHLRGVSLWRLGLEDPKIWELLAASSHSKKKKRVKAFV